MDAAPHCSLCRLVERQLDRHRGLSPVGRRMRARLRRSWARSGDLASYLVRRLSMRRKRGGLRRLNTDNNTAESSLVGTPNQVIEQMHSFIDLGVDHFELALPFEHPISKHCFELLAHEVLPAFDHQPMNE
jgi:alkanesulfonate monooxygenase SsuD/methylene tetrahydromethanopterin reductase-like flavin-dependent oxidoreductase (luciferase family)